MRDDAIIRQGRTEVNLASTRIQEALDTIDLYQARIDDPIQLLRFVGIELFSMTEELRGYTGALGTLIAYYQKNHPDVDLDAWLYDQAKVEKENG